MLFSPTVFVCLTEKDFIGLDKSGQRVLMLSADSDMDKLAVRISQLKRLLCFTVVCSVHVKIMCSCMYWRHRAYIKGTTPHLSGVQWWIKKG